MFALIQKQLVKILGWVSSVFDLVFPQFYVEMHSENAILPKKSTRTAAGYDLYSTEELTIPKWERRIVPTDITVHMRNSPFVYARIAPRSGMAVKGIHVGAGVVDSDYVGKIGVVLFNMSNDDFVVHAGDRIAQLIFERVLHPRLEVVSEASLAKTESDRGTGGFGSTGD